MDLPPALGLPQLSQKEGGALSVTDVITTTVGSAVIVNVVRDRSGTIIAQSVWDDPTLPSPMRNTRHTRATPQSPQ